MEKAIRSLSFTCTHRRIDNISLRRAFIRAGVSLAIPLVTVSCNAPADVASDTGENQSNRVERQSTTTAARRASDHPNLTIKPTVMDNSHVQLTIETNLPTPIKVSASVSLHGQRDDDVYIGYDEFVTLTGPSTVAVFDTSKATNPLPAGKYDATVDFYPSWGAKENPAAAEAPRLTASTEFSFRGTGVSATELSLKLERHRWVLKSINGNMPWNRQQFEQRLGKAVKGRSEQPLLYDAYFFPGANATLLVHKTRGEVTTWKDGNAIIPPNVSRAKFEAAGLTWPLKVDQGYIGCTGSAVWFDTTEGKRYAVNGTARASYPFIEPIWSPSKNQSSGGPRVNINDLLIEGMKMCT